jgi:hypothetical protein
VSNDSPARAGRADLSRASDHAIRAVSAVPGPTARVADREGDVVLDEHLVLCAVLLLDDCPAGEKTTSELGDR